METAMTMRTLLMVVACSAGALGAGEVDVLIRGAQVHDGTGAPARQVDVALRGDRIVAVGAIDPATAATVIDGTGLVLAPGFIDGHYHGWPGLSRPELAAAEPLLAQGVTTVVLNPDGGGPSNLIEQRAALEAAQPAVNTALMVPHNTVRTEVIGRDNRRATPTEMAAMERKVRAGMEAGAFGLSTGPFYTPGAYSDTAELVALARVAAEYGGFYTSHVRDEGDYNVGLLQAVEEVITIGRETGMPVVWTHAKALGAPTWPVLPEVIVRVEQARAEGVDVWADHYPYTAGRTSLEAALVSAPYRAGGSAALRQRLRDRRQAREIRADIATNLVRRGGPESLLLSIVRLDRKLAGKRLDEIMELWKVDAVEAAVRLLQGGGASVISFTMRDEDVDLIMRQPWTMTCSDGSLTAAGEDVPHPRSFGSYAHKLGHYVREREVLSWEAAIHSMSGLPARVFKLTDRGEIRAGAYADLVLFDPAQIHSPATYLDSRQLAVGVIGVWVNGERVWADGAVTPARPGRVLRPSR